jgi:type IV pilus assembly protein PilA
MVHLRRWRIARARGVTLVEVAVVVVIISILATLAVVGYRKQVKTARLVEGTNMVKGVDTGQAAYKAERGKFADISVNGTTTYPTALASLTNSATQWGAACPSSACLTPDAWELIQLQADTPVFFGYTVVASDPTSSNAPQARMGADITLRGKTISFSSKAEHWYAVRAFGNMDGRNDYSGPNGNTGTGLCNVFHQVVDAVGAAQTSTEVIVDCD